jgi:hypothetical protein
LVALAIARRMNIRPRGDGHSSFPSALRLARETHLCERTVRARIKELQGMSPPLFVIKRGGPTHGYAHRSFQFRLAPDTYAGAGRGGHPNGTGGGDPFRFDEETGNGCRFDAANVAD